MEIVFKSSPFTAIAGPLGIALLLVGGPALVALSVFVAVWVDSSPKAIAICVAEGAVGIGMFYLAILGVRGWFSFLTKYVLTQEGVSVDGPGATTFLPWTDLTAARFRRAAQYFELTFHNSARKVVLINIDVDPAQRRIKAALNMVQDHANFPIQKTLL